MIKYIAFNFARWKRSVFTPSPVDIKLVNSLRDDKKLKDYQKNPKHQSLKEGVRELRN